MSTATKKQTPAQAFPDMPSKLGPDGTTPVVFSFIVPRKQADGSVKRVRVTAGLNPHLLVRGNGNFGYDANIKHDLPLGFTPASKDEAISVLNTLKVTLFGVPMEVGTAGISKGGTFGNRTTKGGNPYISASLPLEVTDAKGVVHGVGFRFASVWKGAAQGKGFSAYAETRHPGGNSADPTFGDIGEVTEEEL